MGTKNKKTILFTCGELKLGGVERSLISLLNEIDYETYSVSLMVPTLKGELINQVPNQVQMIESPEIIRIPKFQRDTIKKDLSWALKNSIYLVDFIRSFCTGLKYGSKIAKQRFWGLIRKKYKLNKEAMLDFDVAISYAGGIGLWNQLIIDVVNAKKKICWIHGDYSVFGTRTELEKEYMKKFDTVVSVSSTVEQILLREIPELKGRTTVIHNIINKKYIHEMAEKENVYNDCYQGIRFVSVSRLDKCKGLDLAITAFSRAVQDGYEIKWDIIGDGPERNTLLKLINKLNLDDNVRLIGKKLNPYPYLKGADVFFHPSKGEGKSMSVDEAKLMGKPILITSYPTVRDQIEDGITGKVVPISEEGLYKGIVEMAVNGELRGRLINNLTNFNIGKESIENFLKIIEF